MHLKCMLLSLCDASQNKSMETFFLPFLYESKVRLTNGTRVTGLGLQYITSSGQTSQFSKSKSTKKEELQRRT